MFEGGFDLDNEDDVKERNARFWLADVTGDDRFRVRSNYLHKLLGSGVILCRILNKIKKGTVPKINPDSTMRFRCIENIQNYISGCQRLGVSASFVFSPLDLFEGKNMHSVILNILYLKHLVEKGDLKFEGDEDPIVVKPAATLPTTSPSTGISLTAHFAEEKSETKSVASSKSTELERPGGVRLPSRPNSKQLTPGDRGHSMSLSPKPRSADDSDDDEDEDSGDSDSDESPKTGTRRSPSAGDGKRLSTLDLRATQRGQQRDVTTSVQDQLIKDELKYNTAEEEAVKEWICGVLKKKDVFPLNTTFIAALKDGVTLCEVLNALKPGLVPKITRTPRAFAGMQNIPTFLHCCELLGVPRSRLFVASDLMDTKNANRVLDGVHALAEHAISRGLTDVALRNTSSSRTLFSQTISEMNGPADPDEFWTTTTSGSVISEEDLTAKCEPGQEDLLHWVNMQFEKAEMSIELHNFSGDVRDGLKLLRLAEALMQEECFGIVHDPAKLVSERMHNACLLFWFIEQNKLVDIQCCKPQDVVLGNSSRVFALVSYMREIFDLDYAFVKMLNDDSVEGEEAIDDSSFEQMKTMMTNGSISFADVKEQIENSSEGNIVITSPTEEERKRHQRTESRELNMMVGAIKALTRAALHSSSERITTDTTPSDIAFPEMLETTDTRKKEEKKEPEEEKKEKKEEVTVRVADKDDDEEEKKDQSSEKKDKKDKEKKDKKDKEKHHGKHSREKTMDGLRKTKTVKGSSKKRSSSDVSSPFIGDVPKSISVINPVKVSDAEAAKPERFSSDNLMPEKKDDVRVTVTESDTKPEEAKETKEVKEEKKPTTTVVTMNAAGGEQPTKSGELEKKPEELGRLKREGSILRQSISLTTAQKLKVMKAQLQMRKRVATEILTTEESYVSSLNILCDQIVQPLIDMGKSWKDDSSKQTPLSEEEVLGIFANVKQLRNDHLLLLDALKARFAEYNGQESTMPLSDVFLDHMKTLEHYAPYLQNYASAAAALHFFSERNEPTKNFIERFELEQTGNKKLNVPSFLVMPVQRLPRYVMLFNDLAKYTPKDHKDAAFVARVTEELPPFVASINKTIDPVRAETMQKEVDIANKISGSTVDLIVRRERKLLREGPAKKVAKDSKKIELGSKKGYVFLFDTMIVACHVSAKKDHPYSLCKCVEIRTICNLLATADEIIINYRASATNNIIGPDIVSMSQMPQQKTLTITMSSSQEVEDWRQTLIKCMKDCSSES